MGKLNIAHHKSYHPYRLDNIERVRRDEEAAKLKQTEDTDRALVADAESRLDALRSRAGINPPHSPPPGDGDAECPAPPVASGSGSSSITLSNGHINLFADLEEHTAALAARASKSKPAVTDADRGVALAPTKQDLNPWYSSSSTPKENDNDKTAAARRQRDLARQVRADPLASIPSHLMRPSRTTPSLPPPPRYHPPRSRHPQPPQPPPQQPQPAASSASREGRLARESAERERALALVRRKQRERAESATATPSTVHGGYADVFNRLEVEDAHRERDRAWRQRRWEDDAGIGRRPRSNRH
ncbi:hypothetical protein EDB92DRAFT_1801332 [Lactarius akahatsu]|uniref:CBF1-interacting co-repressor CIR N-terminal domain-containing protein n=1 Tax=Lactarius akahatsu TaxID=416441 RepID=A0AAD4QBN9_9AGAM|nr:hypothetical protein EDB92DRAFT_1801332 [Lactarius akahatsu]